MGTVSLLAAAGGILLLLPALAHSQSEIANVFSACEFGGDLGFLQGTVTPVNLFREELNVPDIDFVRDGFVAIGTDVNSDLFWTELEEGQKEVLSDSSVRITEDLADGTQLVQTVSGYAADVPNLCTCMDLESRVALGSGNIVTVSSQVATAVVEGDGGDIFVYRMMVSCDHDAAAGSADAAEAADLCSNGLLVHGVGNVRRIVCLMENHDGADPVGLCRAAVGGVTGCEGI